MEARRGGSVCPWPEENPAVVSCPFVDPLADLERNWRCDRIVSRGGRRFHKCVSQLAILAAKLFKHFLSKLFNRVEIGQ